MSVDSYRAGLGRTPPHHRFGGEFINTATMNRVAHHGIPVDLTPEPGVPVADDGPLHGGWLLGGTGDFLEIPRSPYRPDPHDFRSPAADGSTAGLTVIPMTSGAFRRRRYPARALRARARHPVATTVRTARWRLSPKPGPGYELLAMWKDWRRPSDFWDSAFAAAEQVTPHFLSFAIRSSCGVDGQEQQRFDTIIEQLLRDPRARDLRFVTPTRALATLTSAPAH